MLVREAFTSILFFLFAFHISGTYARPSFSLNSKRSHSASSLAARSELEYSTNAKRMAAGLQPRAPTRVFDPRHFNHNNGPKPSAVPYSGTIRVDKRSGGSLGYLGSNLVSGRFTVTSNSNQKLGVSFNYLNTNTELQLKITSDSSSYPYVGAKGGILLSNAFSFDNSKADLVRTNQVGNSGSVSGFAGNSSGSGITQSFIWKFNPTTKEITASWTHLWGDTDVYIFYRANDPGKGLYLSADSDLGNNYTRVKFFLE
ncbi:hypothetical protein CVT24_007063 [Panaeolus cyanescens]|uniref:Uncharacterized protein n=1 Tax=Panaeolus cyanescens TaxID=181874 RepID=A0A409VJR7_9AGAR|nr:hypothetical protein CVT24_007063 [Panaeolus cyanescens]